MEGVSSNRLGTHLDFKEELIEDLMNRYINSGGGTFTDIVERIVCSEAKRFYVSELQCYKVMLKMVASIPETKALEGMLENRKEMYVEIYKRLMKFLSSREGAGRSIYSSIGMIIYERAPKFYISKYTAMKLITQKFSERKCAR